MDNLTILDKDMNVILNKDDLIRIKVSHISDPISPFLPNNCHTFTFKSLSEFPNQDKLKESFLNKENVKIKINNNDIIEGPITVLVLEREYFNEESNDYYQIKFTI